MAVYPAAIWRPIPENSTQPSITPTQVILHSAVDADGPTSLYSYFGRADIVLESHFFIMLNGTVEQYMNTTVRADANRDANVRAISIETEDDGEPDQRPWTDAQLNSIKRLLDWLFVTHNIPRRVCPAWDQPGVGYHVMWGAPSHWTPVVKSCPGTVRIQQFNNVIRPWLAGVTPPPPRPRAKDSDNMLFLYHPNGGRSFAVSDNGYEQVSGDLLREAGENGGLVLAPTAADADAILNLAQKGNSVVVDAAVIEAAVAAAIVANPVTAEVDYEAVEDAVRNVFADAGQE